MEFLIGSLLLFGYAVRWNALAVSGISFGFIVVLIWNYFATGAFPEDCGCFGESSFFHLTGFQVLILDMIDLPLGLLVFSAKEHILSLDGWLLKKVA